MKADTSSIPRTFLLLAIAATLSFLNCGSGPGNSGSGSSRDNPITLENAKSGDAAWKLTDPANNHEIEGFASATSVNRGEDISFFVNTEDSSYTMEIFRMGWYGGAGARSMMPPVTRTGRQQPIPSPDPDTNLIECQWTDPYVLTIPNNPQDPTDWASGVYLVKLTAVASGKQSYIIFVVRDDARKSDLLFNCDVNTYQAYNSWGGRSLYSKPRAFKVSFNRPYRPGEGAGDFLQAEWEYNMLRFLEREGYDVTYSTDVDTHLHGNLLLSHKAVLVMGHGEYWSWQMRNNFEAARDAGVNLGFFAANTGYWQIRYEPSALSGTANRTVVGYKSDALTKDPLALDGDPSNDYLITTLFRLPPVNRPEDALIGVMYQSCHCGRVDGDIVVADDSSWVFEGTGLHNGDHLQGLLGAEVDKMFGHAPAGTTVIARSPFPNPEAPGGIDYAEMTVYTTAKGSTVVATGSEQWSWGLDDYATNHTVRTNPAAQEATRNILKRFGATSSQAPM